MSRPRREPPPLPKRPYRDSLLLNVGLAVLILLIAFLTGGELGRAILFAIGFLVLATAWNWWRIRQRLERGARS